MQHGPSTVCVAADSWHRNYSVLWLHIVDRVLGIGTQARQQGHMPEYMQNYQYSWEIWENSENIAVGKYLIVLDNRPRPYPHSRVPIDYRIYVPGTRSAESVYQFTAAALYSTVEPRGPTGMNTSVHKCNRITS